MQSLEPRWSRKELRTFYILLKAHGQQWDKLKERLPQRSEASVRALFEMHRGYLSLPEASVEGFCAILTDQYKAQDELPQDAGQDDVKQERQDADNDKQSHQDAGQDEPPRSRKKRRLEKLLATDQLVTRADPVTEQAETRRRTTGRKSATPTRSRSWLDSGLDQVTGRRFDLPWCHWFYSFVDVDFFRHNEFIECLSNMGLRKITVAARPIWSSVRASMGHARRLSPFFFVQEKEKLEAYRAVKRRFDTPSDKSWPYRCPAPLLPGVSVMVWAESERRFRLATVAAFLPKKGVCQVFFWDSVPRVAAVACSLDNVMVLDFPPWSGESEDHLAEPKLAATTLLRREHAPRGRVAPVTERRTTSSCLADRFREEKIRAVLAVKSLLHRKETIVSILAKLNERVAEQQIRLHEETAKKSSLWTTPTAFSSAAVKDLAWANSREKAQLQKQHAWLAANLDATNSYLKAALLSLQSFASTDPPEAGGSSVVDSAYASAGDGDSLMAPTETLNEDQMRWAIDFLAASQKKAATVVKESALHVVKEDQALPRLNDPTDDVRLGSVLPGTMQQVANCVTLMSVLHRHVAASPDVPQVVTQKLVERVLELLKPSHEANMDLYAELRVAVEAAQAQMALQATTNGAD
ncbi:hypothetical protein PRIC1_014370 [Phytophthora ramorum]|uniref:Protein ALWAYS EARLY 3 n=1 Tax=Phytophthora ramorum TaxID=164328 RepID=UPI003098DA98|nr:Protein ALWAYS EARLY 3 [Phytophthora ramorum]KAH7497694.1 Protein ALWAYS EARLY 3 [Phytophthora ramorum]